MYRIGKEEIDAVARVIRSGNLFKINDACKESEQCEAEMRDYFGIKNVLVMTSGKAALISALTALGIGPGDEVIVPAYTYIATAMAVVAVGAIPVIAEVDDTLTLDIADTEKKISRHTKALLPVHIQGFPCNMEALQALAEKYGLKIVEDACQAVGGSYKGKSLGTIGDAGAFSFNQFKIISAGEGGALLTDSRAVYERALIYHDSSAVAYFGKQLQEIRQPVFCGTEYRTNEITCAILREQLKKLPGILADLRRNKKAVMEALDGKYAFVPSNDSSGDCGTTIAFRFASEAEARRFAAADGIGGLLPIDTGKHIYTHWTAILEKRGALNAASDPFRFAVNQELNSRYSPEMCPKTLELLAKTVYVGVNPDWTENDLDKLMQACLKLIR